MDIKNDTSVTDFLVMALSIGQDLKLRTNCNNFASAVHSWGSFESVSVWIKDEYLNSKTAGQTERITHFGEDNLLHHSISSSDSIYNLFKNGHWIIISNENEKFDTKILDHDLNQHTVGLFELRSFGFFKIVFKTNEELQLLKTNIDSFLMLIENFINSIEACVAFQESVIEKEKARNEAETALMAKKTFLSAITRKIRDPLTAVLGLSELLVDSKLKTKQEDYVNKIKLSANNLLNFLNEILDLTKLEANQLPIVNSNFRISDLFTSLDKQIEPLYQAKNLKFTYNIDSWLKMMLLGDFSKINQVLLNILCNAIKFTEKGEVKLSCKVVRQHKSGCLVEFSVQDTGIGIEAEQLDIIFEKFLGEDGDNPYLTTRIGLTLAQQLVELMDGEIKVESIPGLGSNFKILLDLQYANDDESGKHVEPQKLDRKKTSKIKVLLVENDPINKEIGQNYLSDWDVSTVENGQKTIELIEKGSKFDIILLNLVMRPINGIETTRIIRNKFLLKTPIIAIFSEPNQDYVEDCKKVGINDFLIKPYSKSALIDAVVVNLQRTDLYLTHSDEEIVNKFSKKLVLMVDDDEINQITTRAMLQSFNCKVESAANGALALEKISNSNFDLIITDLFMPEMDGFELASNLRELSVITPIIAFSSDDSLTTIERCKQAGMEGLLLKKLYNRIDWAKQVFELIKDNPLWSD